MVSQFEGGWTVTEPSSAVVFRAGIRRAFGGFEVDSVFSSFTITLLGDLVELLFEVARGPSDASISRLRRFVGGARRSSISSVFAEEREEQSSSLSGACFTVESAIFADELPEYAKLRRALAATELRVWRRVGGERAWTIFAVSFDTREVRIVTERAGGGLPGL